MSKQATAEIKVLAGSYADRLEQSFPSDTVKRDAAAQHCLAEVPLDFSNLEAFKLGWSAFAREMFSSKIEWTGVKEDLPLPDVECLVVQAPMKKGSEPKMFIATYWVPEQDPGGESAGWADQDGEEIDNIVAWTLRPAFPAL